MLLNISHLPWDFFRSFPFLTTTKQIVGYADGAIIAASPTLEENVLVGFTATWRMDLPFPIFSLEFGNLFDTISAETGRHRDGGGNERKFQLAALTSKSVHIFSLAESSYGYR